MEEFTLKSIDDKELKNIELRLLVEVDRICKMNSIRYSLCYGTLLGAVRHGGFIPWDDDIDICMPRPDYNRFVKYCENNKVNFSLLAFETQNPYLDIISKVYNQNTVIEEENTNRFQSKTGVYIDIFPIESLGNTYEEAKRNFGKSTISRELLNASLWKKYFLSKTHAWYYEPARFVLYLLSRFISPKRTIAKILECYSGMEYDNTEYVGVIGSAYRTKDIIERHIIEEYTEVDFEGLRFMAFKEYDAYLKHIYSDYMKLPPEEKRVSHHMFKAYYL